MTMLFGGMVQAQHTLTAYIKDKETQEALPGATIIISGTQLGGSANEAGLVIIKQVSSGTIVLETRYLGYVTAFDTINTPFPDTLTIYLEPAEDDLEDIVIQSTRSSRTISDIPTRVEFIAGEELDEKANMKPGDIRMVLNESTGIQTQQTSATSANASIRIQGLDGRYTQILKDGFPLYSGASSGLGLLQIPPLDLKQVEVIKGSASTLYGGGAIAGLVNLISKTPQQEGELKFHLNGTNAKGLDLNGFYGKRFNKFGITTFIAHNRNGAYDPANIGFTAIPKFERYTVNPRLFFYPNAKTTINAGINTTFENRTGGDLLYIENKGDSTHSYYEKNITRRFSTQFTLNHKLSANSQYTLKNSVSYFNRKLTRPGYTFNGTQYSTFSEVNYNHHTTRSEWIAGINLWTDKFDEQQPDSTPVRNYTLNTIGAFVQNVWNAKSWLSVESGFRTDYVFDFGFAFLPRVSALFKIHPKVSSRVGGGLGYKAPTIFTEESERIQYRGVLPINAAINKMERSYGGNADLTYRTSFAQKKISLHINQLFFYTYLDNPLTLLKTTTGVYQFQNFAGYTETKGMETNVKIGYQAFKLFLGYTLTDTKLKLGALTKENPLTPKHRINAVLMFEVEEKWKIGLESYYFSKQKLSDGSTGQQYVIMGFMAERLWEKFSLYINFENFMDARQTRFGTIYTGSATNPVFRDIYAPLDGFVINGGIKLNL